MRGSGALASCSLRFGDLQYILKCRDQCLGQGCSGFPDFCGGRPVGEMVSDWLPNVAHIEWQLGRIGIAMCGVPHRNYPVVRETPQSPTIFDQDVWVGNRVAIWANACSSHITDKCLSCIDLSEYCVDDLCLPRRPLRIPVDLQLAQGLLQFQVCGQLLDCLLQSKLDEVKSRPGRRIGLPRKEDCRCQPGTPSGFSPVK
jgi:hypothetical protein